MEFDRHKWRYLVIEQLDNGLTAAFEAWLEDYKSNHKDTLKCVWTIAFCVSKKKKYVKQWMNGGCSVLDEKITGKGDLTSLIWAKNKLIEFEEELKKGEIFMYDNTSNKIVIHWDDNKRRNAYEKYLTKKMGYVIHKHDNKKCLMKIIKKEGDC